MTEYQTKSPSKVYNVANRLLNQIIRKKFGKHITIRVNSLQFIDNRSTIFKNVSHNVIAEEINLKSTKKISLEELEKINRFLFNQLNNILLMVELDDYIEVTSIRLVIN